MAQTVMGKYKQPGSNIDYTPDADVTAGQVIALSSKLCGFALEDIEAGRKGAVSIDCVADLPKATGAGKDIPFGELVYFDFTNGIALQINSGATLCGISMADAATTDEFVSVKFVPQGVQGT